MMGLLSNRPALGPQIRCPRNPGFVNIAAQLLALGARHDGHVGGLIEFEQPTRLIRLARIGGRSINRVRGQAREFGAVGDAARIGTPGVEHILGKLGGQLCKALGDFAVTSLFVGLQIDSGQPKIAQRVVHHLALRQFECGALMLQHVGISRLQRGVLPEFRGIRGEQRHAFVVRLAHLRRVRHRVQMADRAPDAAQPVAELLDGGDQGSERRTCLRRQFREPRAILRQHFLKRGTRVARFDAAERGQRFQFQKRVVHVRILSDVQSASR